MHFRAHDTGQVKEVVDENAHAPRPGANPSKVVLTCYIQIAGIILFKGLTETLYAAQRSAEIMGDRIGKRFQFFVRNFQFRASSHQFLFRLSFLRSIARNLYKSAHTPSLVLQRRYNDVSPESSA